MFRERLKRAFAVLIHIHRIRQGFAHGIVAKKNSEDQKQRRQRKQDSSVFLFLVICIPILSAAGQNCGISFVSRRSSSSRAGTDFDSPPAKRGKPRFVS